MNSVLRPLMQQGRYPYGKWFRVVEDHRERYILQSEHGSGQSSDALPNGKSAAFTIDVRGHTPVTDALDRFVTAYERGSVLAYPFCQLVTPTARSDARADLGADPMIAARLRKCLDACSPIYNLEAVLDFRHAHAAQSTTEVEIEGRKVPLVTPEQIMEFSQRVGNLRAAYAADLDLAGSVEGACLISTKVATQALAAGENAPSLSFVKLATHFRYSPWQNPVRIFNSIIQQAIDEGFVDLVVELAEAWGGDVHAKTAEARSATSIDAFLDALYNIAPRAFAVLHIYGRLVASKSRLDPKYAGMVEGRLNAAEEDLARVGGTGCCEQISDFEGKAWEWHCRVLRRVIQTDGEPAASDAINGLERSLAYPAPVLAVLLREAKSPGISEGFSDCKGV